jgi:four helix bundle protein
MTYERFEDLPVWQTAADLYDAAVALLEHRGLRASAAFRDQLERAALSVSNNIAEGFERGTTNELLAFIYIARGSAGEVRSMLRLLLRRLNRLQANPVGAEQGASGQGGVDQTPPEQGPCAGQAGGADLQSVISNLKSEVARLIALAESCSRQLRAWADSLQNSEIKGQRFLTEQTRQQEQQRKRAEAFQKELLRRLPPGNPLRKDAEERGLI